MANVTTGAAKLERPKKPYKGFPLSAHASGKWQKKIKGKIQYFGNWAVRRNGKLVAVDAEGGWAAALEEYKHRYPDGPDGTEAPKAAPVDEPEGLTVRQLCNEFLNAQNRKVANGSMQARTMAEYRQMTDLLVKVFGRDKLVEDLGPSDFATLAVSFDKFGPIRRGNNIQRVRTIFKFASDNKLVPSPVAFGTEFKKPSKAAYRKNRASKGKKLFTADEVRAMLDGKEVTDNEGNAQHLAGADPITRAMILLGINCGLGNTDCAKLAQSHLDLDGGWLEYSRPKTGIERRAKLWPETVAALRLANAQRPTPLNSSNRDLVFVTPKGHPVVRVRTKYIEVDGVEMVDGADTINAVAAATRKLLKRLGINGRKRLGFECLRHTFRTVADATKDFPAVLITMGHADNSISDAYRESIDDDRLEAIANHVHAWLFAKGGDQ